MNAFLAAINVEQMSEALWETLYMSMFSLVLAVVIGLILGITLYLTDKGGLLTNKYASAIIGSGVNIFRAMPYIILMIIMIPITKALTGSMLGAKAAVPSLIVAAAPFYARLTVIALSEVDKGTVEASKAMGASTYQIITKVLLPESLPALVSGVAVTGINLVSYTAMAGAIGAGGLGQLAYLYGFVRQNNAVLYTATILIMIIVFAIQGLGDYLVKKIDKR
ncbi:MAG: ABC transporter permease [Erysipelotrichaceae bacterium]|nr:ABC transporter permease [Erysipelotrichaceae bacterium]MBQ9986816.1 ABC transporter permease [Erysipelotrichales bacterium]MBR3694386.1 ABC transporter permease [Erysipelotrichales bacterium]